jgi:hypothetical protein
MIKKTENLLAVSGDERNQIGQQNSHKTPLSPTC